MARALFAGAVSLACVLTTVAADWPQFRGPTGQGTSTVRGLPVMWDTVKNVPWKIPVPGAGWSSPILHSERIYLTTAVPEANGDLSLRAICIDSHTGKVLWNTEVLSTTPTGAHQKNTHASATPVCDGERLYAHFGHYGTAALNLKGTVLWRNTSLKYPPLHGNGGSPALFGDALVFSCDGTRDPFVAALNTKSGEVLWKTPRRTKASRTFSFSTPLEIQFNSQSQVVVSGSGAVMAYDPKSGAEKWRVHYGEGYSVVPRPVFGHGLVFVATGFDRPTVIAIRPDGEGDVTAKNIAWTINRGAPNTPSPLLVGDELYFISDAGIMTCADARTGNVHWQERVGGNYSASLVAADGKIYVQSEEGVGTVLKAGKTFEVLAKNDLKERTLASYALDEGVIYIRTAQYLYRIQEPIPSR